MLEVKSTWLESCAHLHPKRGKDLEGNTNREGENERKMLREREIIRKKYQRRGNK